MENGDAPKVWPRLAALAAGPVVGGLVYGLMSNGSGAPASACVTAGIAVWMAVWWMTEAIPLAATALIPIVSFPFAAVYQSEWSPGLQVSVVPATNQTGSVGDGETSWTGVLVKPVEDGWLVAPGAEGETVVVASSQIRPPKLPQKNQFKTALLPYANKFVFLFLGGFLIAQAIQRWGLHRRMALNILLRVGSSPARLVGGFMLSTALMSMWLSNTATTIVMLPVAGSLINQFRQQREDDGRTSDNANPSQDTFAICLMLAIAYSATIGGISTLIGTPPNALLATQMEELGTPIPFATWMFAALPLSAVLLVVTWWLLVKLFFPLKQRAVESSRDYLLGQLRQLGKISTAELGTCCVFASVALLWIFRTPISNWDWLVSQWPYAGRLDDSMIAVAGALVLFMLPVQIRPLKFALDWEHAKKIPWEILLLFGGGLSLSKAINSSGLGQWLGESVAGMHGGSQMIFILVVVLTVIFLTEFSSNLATAALFLPLLASLAPQILLADGSPLNPAALMIPTALAASCAFMLPVATPPNAIVFGSGNLQIRHMVKAGIWLNLIGAVLITIWTMTYGRWLLGF